MTSLKDSISRNFGTAALITALALSLGLNVFLASRGGFAKRASTPSTLQTGASVPAHLPLEDVNGRPVNISFADDQRPTVLYVLSPHCGWCKRNEANMAALYAASSEKYRFIGVSIDDHDLQKYIEDRREPFPVYLLKSGDIARQLHITGTPETIVVNPAGKVIHAWEGVYVSTNEAEVEKFFGAKLPGLPQ